MMMSRKTKVHILSAGRQDMPELQIFRELNVLMGSLPFLKPKPICRTVYHIPKFRKSGVPEKGWKNLIHPAGCCVPIRSDLTTESTQKRRRDPLERKRKKGSECIQMRNSWKTRKDANGFKKIKNISQDVFSRFSCLKFCVSLCCSSTLW